MLLIIAADLCPEVDYCTQWLLHRVQFHGATDIVRSNFAASLLHSVMH